ncbi:MAG: hypothetical protein KatS3mg014_2426 [Actinomycetota bacterium]|nr:MAG: hypothetical protein KatS3mg014_2426 [Actinomycetota bacterium]
MNPPVSGSPVRYPTATRAGYPRARTSTAIAVENCWQKPVFVSVRKRTIARASATGRTDWE